jgi:DNA-binding transcriptional LysR family regulator
VSRELGAVPFVVCAAPTYLAKYGAPQAPHELERHTCLIDLTQKTQPNLWQFTDEQGAVYDVCVGGSFRSNLESAVLAAAVRGAGVARLPAYTIEAEIKAERLIDLFPGRVQSDRAVKVFYPRSKYLPKKVRAFIEMLEKHLDSSGPRLS